MARSNKIEQNKSKGYGKFYIYATWMDRREGGSANSLLIKHYYLFSGFGFILVARGGV